MSATRLHILFDRFLAKTCTPAEKQELAELILSKAHEQTVSALLEKAWAETNGEADMERGRADELFQSILAASPEVVPVVRPVSFLRRWGWVAAAVMLLAIGATVAVIISSDRQTVGTAQLPMDIAPGKTGAILILADGTQVSLDTIQNGVVALQGGVSAKVVNGSLVYEGKGDVVAYNTMTTPKGRQFQLILPDGTQVWLNAASSIRYPTTFTGNQRLVEVTGEAYFEVTKNPEQPFRVNVNGKADIKVLGTHFNVNAYENEETISTTLIEGAIAVAVSSEQSASGSQTGQARQGIVLRPGQQAQITVTASSSSVKVINDADIEKAISWKNGVFNFNNIEFDAAMRQLERWYDIEVVYQNKVPNDIELNGEITKDVTLNDALSALKEVGVKCQLEGRKLIIFNK